MRIKIISPIRHISHISPIKKVMKTKHIQFTTTGTCSRGIDITADENNIIQQVQFIGGCPGNTIGVARLAEGRHIDDVIASTRGILCGNKPTSCPDQLSQALEILKQTPAE